ncbi:MAG: DUF3131 domain-containing protein, partial [Candidatus Omnitrophica bacterium]|nr:DUF3131 domain-containing protein [Candidatus Omnitrophota bacterium]
MKRLLTILLLCVTVLMGSREVFADWDTLRLQLDGIGISEGDASYWADQLFYDPDTRSKWIASGFIDVTSDPLDIVLNDYGQLSVFDMLITLANSLTSIGVGSYIGEYLYYDEIKRQRWIAANYLNTVTYGSTTKPVQITVLPDGVVAIPNMEALNAALKSAGIPSGVSDAYADYIFTDSNFRKAWLDANFITVTKTGTIVTNVILTEYAQIAVSDMYRLIQALRLANVDQWAAEKMALDFFGDASIRTIFVAEDIIKVATSSQGRSVWGISSATDPADDLTYRDYCAPLGMSHGAWVMNEAGVIAPYASFLALDVAPAAAMQNIDNLMTNYTAITGAYGFLDSVDTDNGDVAQAYLSMAQGSILISIANAVENGCIQSYFMDSVPLIISRENLNDNFSGIIADPTFAQLDTTALTVDQKTALRAIAQSTWSYFSSMTTSGTNWLPPNGRTVSGTIADYTSITDIALYMMSVVSAEKLGIIDAATAQQRITDTLATLVTLDKWNGLFHNYYKVATLASPSLDDKFISTVDNGWLASALQVVRQAYDGSIRTDADTLYNAMDFGELYNSGIGLLATGYDVVGGALTNSYYGNIYTEIRPTVLIAIGKGDIPAAVWDRMVTVYPDDWTWQSQIPVNGAYTYNTGGSDFRYIPTWEGTMFEALMPNLVIDNKAYSANGFAIQDRTYVYLQKMFATGALDPGYSIGTDAITVTAYGQTAFGIINSLVGSFRGMADVSDNTAIEAAFLILTNTGFRAEWIAKNYITVTTSGSQVTGVTITGVGTVQLPIVLSGGDSTAMILQIHQAIVDNSLQNQFQLMYGTLVANQSLDNAAYKDTLSGIASYINEHADYTEPGYFTKTDFIYELTKTAALHNAIISGNLGAALEIVSGISVADQTSVTSEYKGYLAGVVNGAGYTLAGYIATLTAADLANQIDLALNSGTLRTDFETMYKIALADQVMTTPAYLSAIQGIASYMTANPTYTIANFTAELLNSAALHNAL